jgi:valyl-tRNA synthetase
MSKSLGNGIDPLDIIESHGADAMRFTLAFMTTQTQDVRMPVAQMTLPDGRKVNSSAKFDMGRNFCNKLWNAARFAMMNLKGTPAWEQVHAADNLSDAWILSRLNRTARDVTEALSAYQFHEAAEALYRCMWNDFCDWYLEIAKVRINAGEARPKSIVAMGLDNLLRLLHPIIPFITEAIWQQLNTVCPYRVGEKKAEELLIKAAWPRAQSQWINPSAEAQFGLIQQIVSGIREIRNTHNVPPTTRLSASAAASGVDAQSLSANVDLICALAGLEKITLEASVTPKPSDGNVLAGGVQLLVHDVVDPQAELAKLKKRQETLAKGVAGAAAKLGNENFLSRAKPDVIAREKERLAGMQDELAAVEKALKQLL